MSVSCVTHFTCLTICIVICATFDQYGRGWTPISNEEIYRRLRSNTQNFDTIKHIDTSRKSNIEIVTEEDFKDDAIKLVKPQTVLTRFTEEKYNADKEPTNHDFTTTCEQKDCAGCANEVIQATKVDNIHSTSKNTSSHNENVRRPKKIDDKEIPSDIFHNMIADEDKQSNEAEQTSIEEQIEGDDTQSYEVTENAEPEIVFDRYASKDNSRSGYVYHPPKANNQTESNYIDTFLNILGKYNINKNDKLLNYEKSRSPLNQKPHEIPKIIYLPIPLSYLHRYNSLNHLPVDPLLAVFLSNYGYYLPNLYGLQNGYKNLYGYLASNNIHNNKPFDNYKIFSDTDSSSK